MITDELLQLITASVDGELTPAESRRLRRLLDSSAEARAVYTKFHADSKKLHALPRVAPPADLHNRVMAKIASLTPVPTRLPKLTTQPLAEPARPATLATIPFTSKYKQRGFAPLTIAAGLLLGVTAVSFLFFNQQNQNPRDISAKRPPATSSGAADPAWAKWLPADTGPRPSAPTGRMPDFGEFARTDFPPAKFPEPDVVVVAPTPRPVRADLVGARPLPETRFDHIEIRLPFLKPISEFDREDVREEFANELSRDPAFRIDLFTRNPARAVELFDKACKAAGVQLFLDANTMTQLQKRTVNATVVYTESLTASDLATLMSKLTVEDGKVTPHVFDQLHATPVSDFDSKDLRSIFGVDPGLFKRPAMDKSTEKTEKPDPTKPLSAGTAAEIVKSVTTGQGKSAVLLTWNLFGRPIPQANSPELKQFLSKRGDRKPNVVPVIIVIRPGNG